VEEEREEERGTRKEEIGKRQRGNLSRGDKGKTKVERIGEGI